ncbi:MAG: 4-hydroxy-tetrahydrodipicolinate reductase [Gemmatimonadota bacterium]|nr:MAG: 4-hydroxy-tetrahydrodipicolinate reductase [Gemmatimonadota bacterium]
MRLALVGYGRMGQAVEKVAVSRGHEVIRRIDPASPAADEPNRPLEDADVAIVFTVPEAVRESVDLVAEAGVDLVVGSTGWSDHLASIEAAVQSAGIGMIHSPNFSMGVWVFRHLAAAAARMIDGLEGYDVRIDETHHEHKADHPSGTAIALAEILVEGLSSKHRWEEEEEPGVRPDAGTLYVTSTRTGEVAGIHEIEITGPDDGLALKHVAKGRAAFAEGAVAAAEWIHGRKGVYTMDDWLGGADR